MGYALSLPPSLSPPPPSMSMSSSMISCRHRIGSLPACLHPSFQGSRASERLQLSLRLLSGQKSCNEAMRFSQHGVCHFVTAQDKGRCTSSLPALPVELRGPQTISLSCAKKREFKSLALGAPRVSVVLIPFSSSSFFFPSLGRELMSFVCGPALKTDAFGVAEVPPRRSA